MKKLVLSFLIIGMSFSMINAQKYFTREAKVKFTSDAPLEKIEAENNSGTSVLDAATGKMEFAVLVKAFQFDKALMQEHFNENYMESSKYPKAIFKGQFQDWGAVDLSKDGSYPVKVKGQMTIHGETNDLEAEGSIVVKNGAISASSNFTIAVADYKIEIPNVVKENIAKTVDISVMLDYQEFKR